ncbi:MAG: serine protease inhibitor ecotin [Tannerella sp.]|jgi:ecotin|nr:serine protease inhibitor ecotin [Tannerella sp.]
MRSRTVLGLFLVCFSMIFGFTANAQQSSKVDEATKALEAFPAAEAGMVRHVIQLKSQKDESLFKIEIMPGKNMLVDCNHHTLMGKLEEKDLQGWGYTYYVFSSDGQTRSTLMACNKPKENKFVYSQTLTVRYNSRLPIVVYAPEGYDVQYRVWSADKKIKNSVVK